MKSRFVVLPVAALIFVTGCGSSKKTTTTSSSSTTTTVPINDAGAAGLLPATADMPEGYGAEATITPDYLRKPPNAGPCNGPGAVARAKNATGVSSIGFTKDPTSGPSLEIDDLAFPTKKDATNFMAATRQVVGACPSETESSSDPPTKDIYDIISVKKFGDDAYAYWVTGNLLSDETKISWILERIWFQKGRYVEDVTRITTGLAGSDFNETKEAAVKSLAVLQTKAKLR
jgi:hypothetical protein